MTTEQRAIATAPTLESRLAALEKRCDLLERTIKAFHDTDMGLVNELRASIAEFRTQHQPEPPKPKHPATDAEAQRLYDWYYNGKMKIGLEPMAAMLNDFLMRRESDCDTRPCTIEDARELWQAQKTQDTLYALTALGFRKEVKP